MSSQFEPGARVRPSAQVTFPKGLTADSRGRVVGSVLESTELRSVVAWDGIDGYYAYAPPSKYIELESDGESTPTVPWRDPRIDPQPGDVLRKRCDYHLYFEVVQRGPSGAADGVHYFYVSDGLNEYLHLAQWQEQMRNAEVLVIVPESKEPAKEQSQPKGNDAK